MTFDPDAWQAAMDDDRDQQIHEGVDPAVLWQKPAQEIPDPGRYQERAPRQPAAWPNRQGARMFGRSKRTQPTEQVRDFGRDEAALAQHARRLAADEAFQRLADYQQANGPVWVDSDHRSVNR